jgi:dCMP deaminase
MIDWYAYPIDTSKWDERFIGMARETAQWSKDPSTLCGAVITAGRRVVSVGYNGFAALTYDYVERYEDRAYKDEMVIHSEENAILQARTDLTGNTLFISAMCCGHCAALIIQTGISRVVVPCKEEDPFSYRGDGSIWRDSLLRAKAHLSEANVELTILQPTGFNPRRLMGPKHPYRPL